MTIPQIASRGEIEEWVDRFLGIGQESPTPTQIAIKGIAIDVIEHWEKSHAVKHLEQYEEAFQAGKKFGRNW